MSHISTFKQLVESIQTLHQDLINQIGKAVNIGLTIRNWLIGGYINDYELQGGDRAEYGERLFDELSQALHGISNCNRRQLYRYLRFYRFYPAIVGTLPPQLPLLPALESILQKVGTASPQSEGTPQLMTRLSYSHFDLLVDIDDNTKRSFYEIECLRGNWSVRELKRQIGSLYYERAGLSHDKLKLAELSQQGAEPQALFNIRDPYIFEFLGLKAAEVMSESQLEDQLLGKLQAFLLELGHGFCFEARQKRILIGDEHFFVDLVFYHRILKCHVLVELKLEAFSHHNIGQLNTYVNWYRQHMMSDGDNPPVGILLCTEKNHALIEYALAGMDNQLFVSKYLLEMPDKTTMQQFIDRQLRELQA
ncbi:PDDEXK nuclease domain-containing protein [Methylomonas sp. MgM2]